MTRTILCLAPLAILLSACGSDEKTTVIKEQPVIVQPSSTPVVVHDDD